MKARRLIGTGSVVVALMVVILWAVYGSSGAPGTAEGADARQGSAAAAALGTEISPATEASVRSVVPAQDPCTLRLRLVGADGALCPGQITYFASDVPPQWLPAMDNISLALARANDDGREFFTVPAPAGEAVLTLAGAKYLWLQATSRRCGGRVYQRVDPFVGERVETLDLAGLRVHAMVWNEEMTSPAGDREIECLVDDRRIAAARTDATGHACIGGLPAGDLIVRLADGAAGEHACARIRAGQRGAVGDVTVLLIAGGRQVDLRVQIDAEFAVARGFPPTLLLHRTDAGRDIVRCVTSTLTPGRSTWQVSVPPGTYEPIILPQGTLAFEGGTPSLEVPDTEKADCRLAVRSSERHRLELSGVPVDVEGVMVRLWREDDVADSADRRIWLGPSTWRRRRETVGNWEGVAHVVARNHARLWISSEPVAAAEADIVVAMVPGMELEVVAPAAAAANGEAAMVTQEGKETIRLLRTWMRVSPAGSEVVAHAILMLPLQAAVVRRLDAHGAVLAERLVEPKHSMSLRL